MTLDRMFERWKEQAQYDDEDSEVEERVIEFLQEGINQIALKRLDNDLTDLAPFESGSDEPDPRIPEWIHPAAVDYALYMWFRDGNLVKQQRAQAYLARFDTLMRKMPSYADETEKQGLPGKRWALSHQYDY